MKNEKEILIVSSEYYAQIHDNLVSGASSYLNNNRISFEQKIAPGCFEIPFLIKKNLNLYSGFIALGCIIRGETYHFEIIANECARKIMDLSVEFGKPIGFGILTCDNYEQAIVRSDPFQKNKGSEAARACIKSLTK